MPEVSPSVLIIRLDAIGDALALTPLLAALQRRSIAADVLLSEASAGVFSSRAARAIVARAVALRSSATSNLTEIERLGRELRERNYGCVLVATEDPAGYRLAGAIGAPKSVGFADPWGKPFKTIWSRRLVRRTIYRSAGLDRRAPHECEVLFRLGSDLVGDESPTRDASVLRPLVLEREPEPDERVAIQITDKWERLGIPFEQVVEMIRRVAATGEPHLLSAANEASYAQRVADATGLAVSRFAEIEAWKAAIGAAPAIVTPDSGALHVAGTIGTPVVAVFPGQRSYALQVARWSPWAAPHRVVRADGDWPTRAAEALAHLLVLR
ncbi:MAG TPA: glycosyltransferase family 9 protein [Candidatus Binatia bacterium]|nr:glycosyltransferase family 9 protein [Candidatus Binatia bacterium]